MPRRRCTPRSRREAPAPSACSTSPRVASDSEHLPSVGGVGDAGRPVHVDADVVVPAQDALAGVDPHPDPHRRTGGPVVRGEAPLGGDRRPDRPRRAGEHDEEGVAVGADLDPAAVGDGSPDDRRVLVQDRRVPVAECLEETGRAFDVGEEERHGPGGQVGHPLTLCCGCSIANSTGRGRRCCWSTRTRWSMEGPGRSVVPSPVPSPTRARGSSSPAAPSPPSTRWPRSSPARERRSRRRRSTPSTNGPSTSTPTPSPPRPEASTCPSTPSAMTTSMVSRWSRCRSRTSPGRSRSP